MTKPMAKSPSVLGHLLDVQKVAGSNPVQPTKTNRKNQIFVGQHKAQLRGDRIKLSKKSKRVKLPSLRLTVELLTEVSVAVLF